MHPGPPRLAPGAVGWARQPVVRANLKGHRLRRKRWNFWSFMSRDFVFSVTVADIDFASFCGFFFVDFAKGERVEGMDLRLPGHTTMPEVVEADLHWRSGKSELAMVQEDGDLAVRFRGTAGFGLWSGVVRHEGREIAVRDLPGWAEEFAHRW